MKNRIISITFILQIWHIAVVFAQTHEFSVYGGGGLSALRYQLSRGDVSGGFGGDVGAGYTYFFNRQWGVLSGVGLGFYGAKADIPYGIKTITPGLLDRDNDPFDMHSVLGGYSETQKAMFLHIPVMAHYQTQQEQGFYMTGGFKAGIPLRGKYSSKAEKLTNTGYYTALNNWGITQEFAGYGVFEDKSFDGSLALGVVVILSLEAGMKWRIGNDLSLYAGAYFDYGLNNAARNGNLPFIRYNAANASEFGANSIPSTFADKVNLMAVGVKLRLAFARK